MAVLRDGQPPSQFRFPNDSNTVHAVLKKLPRGTKIAVEATGSWWWFVEKARELGHEVCLSHPKQTKAIAHARLKSDKVDAVMLLGEISHKEKFSTSGCDGRLCKHTNNNRQ